MARIDELGERQDRVRLLLKGEEIKLYSRYQVSASVFQQPAAFTMALGWGGPAKELTKRYPPATPFELRIGDVVVQAGHTDSCDPEGGGSGTSIRIDGRDPTAKLFDAYVASERSFANKTYLELVTDVLDAIGLKDAIVIAGNDANRKAVSGGRIVVTTPTTEKMFNVVTQEEYEQTNPATKKVVQSTIKAVLGSRWLDVIQNELKKAGIFLWADVGGSFVLARPTAAQSPLARIVHRRGMSRDVGNVIDYRHRNNIAQRYTRAVVYGRAGGTKFGRRKIRGEFVDQEMVKILGRGEAAKEIVYHEPDVDSLKGAEFMARRRIAEANRAGWHLEYTMSGHTTRGLHGEGRVVWAIDTVVEVDDDELGIKGLFYVSDVSFDRNPHTTTNLTLMRPEDLVFGEDVKKAAA